MHRLILIGIILPACVSEPIEGNMGLVQEGCNHLWSKPPLGISAPENIEHRVLDAIDWWEEQVGEEVFYWCPYPHTVIEYPVYLPTPLGGLAHIDFDHMDGYIRSCRIELSTVNPSLMDAVIRHEMGHCLGLSDDEEGTDSLMSIVTSQERDLTESDRELVLDMLNNSPYTSMQVIHTD